MPDISAVLWDLGGVVVGFDQHKIDRSLGLASGKNLDEIFAALFLGSIADADHREGLVELFNTGHIDGAEFYRRLRATIGLKMSYEEFVCAWTDVFVVHYKIVDYLQKLHEENIPQAIVSSTNPLHLEKIVELTRLDILVGRDYFVTTYTVGVEKPHKKLYDAAAACLGVSLRRCAYIDDNKEYVDAALRYGVGAGIHADLSLPDYQEQCITELDALLFGKKP